MGFFNSSSFSGFSNIVKTVAHVGNYVDPHAISIIQIQKALGKKKSDNVQATGETAVAQYGAPAGVVLQVVPGVGTAIGAGLIAASVAANIKLKQDEIAKQKRDQGIADAQVAADERQAYANAGYTVDQMNLIKANQDPGPPALVSTGVPVYSSQTTAPAVGANVANNHASAVGASGAPIAFSAFAPTTSSLLPDVPRVPTDVSGPVNNMPVRDATSFGPPVDHTWMYVGIAAGVIALGVGVYVLMRRR